MKKFLLLFTVFIFVSCSNQKKEDPLKQETETNINVPTVMCDMCTETIKKAVFKLEGVKVVDVDLEKKVAHVEYVAALTNEATIEMAISDAGYDANSRKRNPDAYAELPACCKND